MAATPLSRPGRSQSASALWWCLLGLALVSVILPIAAVRYLPLNDYPFHLARIFILADIDGPVFSRFYEPGHWLLPNIALDAVGLAIAQVTGPELAVRIFVGLALALQLAGAAALHRAAHGRLSLWPLLALVPVYNGIVSYGFLNYLFGAGLALLAAAGWVAYRDRAWVLSFGFIAACVLMLCHMEAFGIFAVIVGMAEIVRAWSTARGSSDAPGELIPAALRLAIAALPFLAAITLFLVLSPTSDDLEGGFSYGGFRIANLIYGPIFAVVSSVPMLDLLAAALAGGLFCWAWWSGRLQISAPILLGALTLAAASVLLPRYMLGSDFGNVRLAPAAVLVAIAAIDIRPATGRRWDALALALAAIIAALAVSRGVGLTTVWLKWEDRIKPIVADFADLPEGAMIFKAMHGPLPVLMPNSSEARAAWKPSVKHVASYAAIDKPRFVPAIYTDPHKQPLHITPAFQAIKDLQGQNPFEVDSPADLATLVAKLQAFEREHGNQGVTDRYISIVGSAAPFTWDPPAGTTLVRRSPRHLLLRLDPPPGLPQGQRPTHR